MSEPLTVLRLCSVFEPPAEALGPGAERFDPIGGLQTHAAALTRCLDQVGVRQLVLTSRLAAAAGATALSAGVTVRRTGMRTRWLRQLWALGALPALLRPGQRVDLVHAHQGEDIAVLVLAALARRVHGCPLVVTVHCSVAHTLRAVRARTLALRWVGGWVEQRLLPGADAVIVLTEAAAAAVVAAGVPADRVRVIPSGADPALFDRPASDPFPQLARPRVLYLGRLAAQKNVADLVLAFAAAAAPADSAAAIPAGCQLLVVGDGPDRADLEALAAASAARERIHFTGLVPHAAVPAVLAYADVLVLPSVYEELGSVLVEAMRAGLPVVATRVGGIPEVVTDGVTGLLVPPGDVGALRQALGRILGDRGLAAAMSAAARCRAADYAWPGLACRVLDTYRNVMGRADSDREARPLPHTG